MIRSAIILIAQLAPCIFLMFMGWGLSDVRGFLANPARAGFIALILAGAIAVFVLRIDMNPLRKDSSPTGSQSLQLATLLILSLALLWFLPFSDRRGILTLKSNDWPYIGLLLFSIAVIVRVAGLKSLGNYFSAYVVLQPSHRLVRKGIYRKIRHPLYLSLLLAPPGVALIFASFLVLPVSFLALLFVRDRIREEECLLASHFGPEFEDYRRNSWKLIPFVL
jgi:protein-S-isoprenylcysteine O-methyltransferase Ste14